MGSSKDFQGYTKCKFVSFTLIYSIVLFFALGPLLFQEIHYKALIYYQKFFLWRYLYQLLMLTLSTYSGFKILKRFQNNEKINSQNWKNVYHAIVLPVYQEEINILRIALKKLSEHKKAQTNYLIFLAMEKHSKNPLERATKLKDQFQSSFKSFRFTIHQLQEGECKGKASNITWCAKRMEPVFYKNNIDVNDVLFTTIDCDNWAPNAYFEEVERHLGKNQWRLDDYMFAPNQMFSININEVNVFNRSCDFMLGLAIYLWSNTVGNIQNAVSNYTLSYNSLKQIGFFDTNPEAMVDDYHTSLKFFWKKSGKVEIIPVPILFNSMSLKTGDGTWADIKARFWQAQRHSMGILDIAYNLNMFRKNPYNIKAAIASINFFINQISCLSFLSLLFYAIASLFSDQIFFTEQLLFIMNCTAALILIYIVAYYTFVRRSSIVLYGQKGEYSIARCIEILVLNPLIISIFSISFAISSFRATVKTPKFETAIKITESNES